MYLRVRRHRFVGGVMVRVLPVVQRVGRRRGREVLQRERVHQRQGRGGRAARHVSAGTERARLQTVPHAATHSTHTLNNTNKVSEHSNPQYCLLGDRSGGN